MLRPSAWRKSLFAMLRHFSELQKALKNEDHPRAGHPFRVSRTHPSALLTKGSPALGAVSGKAGAYAPAFLQRGEKVFSPRCGIFRASKSSEKWGSSSCRTPFPGFPHTPFRPVGESVSLFFDRFREGRSIRSGPPCFRLFFHRRRSLSAHSTTGRLFTTAAQRGQRSS